MKRVCLLVLFLISIVVNSKDLYQGDECKLKDSGKSGLCTVIDQCKYAIDSLKAKKKPQRCDEFVGLYPVVCCPMERSEIKCLKYYPQHVYGIVVAGGEKALSQEFPHMAVLGYGTKDNIQWLCGGSLISDQFILTAAHCLNAEELGAVKYVRLGDLDLKNTTDDAKPQDFTVSQVFVHPNYKLSSHYHDIALVKLDRKATFNDYVKPACLNVENSVPDTLTVTGWGKTEFLGETSSHLMKAPLNRVDYKECSARYLSTSKRKLANGIVDDYQVCAGHPEGKDTCPGDSGGPLQYKVFGGAPYFMIVGVTSFGRGCAEPNSIGVYARVSNYFRWIENIVWPES